MTRRNRRSHFWFSTLYCQQASFVLARDKTALTESRDWIQACAGFAGVQNLFDQYPVDNPWAGIAGAKYGERGPCGFNGGFDYLEARLTW